MANIKAVIYDVDGTLIDTEPLHVKAWSQALEYIGASLDSLSNEFLSTMAGKKPAAIAEGMVDKLDLKVTEDELLTTKTACFLKLVETPEVMPGAIDSIRRFKATGYRLAIGTSHDRPFVDSMIIKLGLNDIFDVIVTADEVSKGKPDPETYLAAAIRLEIKPEECLVFEDARSGVESAKASGAFCIAIKNINAAPQKLDEADAIVSSFDEITESLISAL
ncbi:MAG: HAD family phosphatase [Candidatus Saccharimonadales bacterium]